MPCAALAWPLTPRRPTTSSARRPTSYAGCASGRSRSATADRSGCRGSCAWRRRGPTSSARSWTASVAEALARTLMLQGATSSAGKTYLAAGLCRLYHRRGLRVAPFKAQNMALNSAVTHDGAEIGRAQAVQAEAACVPAEAGMNPVLLKAEADSTCQVILMGR